MHFITAHIFLFLKTEPRALHMLDTLSLNHMPSPLSISLPFDIMALMDSGLRPSGDWSSCGARQLEAVAGCLFNFVHMFMCAWESSRWVASKLGSNLLTSSRNSE